MEEEDLTPSNTLFMTFLYVYILLVLVGFESQEKSHSHGSMTLEADTASSGIVLVTEPIGREKTFFF